LDLAAICYQIQICFLPHRVSLLSIGVTEAYKISAPVCAAASRPRTSNGRRIENTGCCRCHRNSPKITRSPDNESSFGHRKSVAAVRYRNTTPKTRLSSQLLCAGSHGKPAWSSVCV
ncbi:hypothetical protein NPIL_11341, partial [Nephila pilipes]